MSKVRASHLLVKHSGSRRPASWRDPDGQLIGVKTKEAAIAELLAFREQIVASACASHIFWPAVAAPVRAARQQLAAV